MKLIRKICRLPQIEKGIDAKQYRITTDNITRNAQRKPHPSSPLSPTPGSCSSTAPGARWTRSSRTGSSASGPATAQTSGSRRETAFAMQREQLAHHIHINPNHRRLTILSSRFSFRYLCTNAMIQLTGLSGSTCHLRRFMMGTLPVAFSRMSTVRACINR